VKRILFLVGGAAAIFGSYMAVLFGVAPEPGFGPATLASIALPALVSGFVMTAFIAMESRAARETTGMVSSLNAQLARKEIEIGRLSSMDELTGLTARNRFDGIARAEFDRSTGGGHPLSLLIIELDEADQGQGGALSKGYLLAEVASIVRSTLRVDDVGARYGDHSLAVLLPDTDEEQAQQMAEHVRRLVSERQFVGERAGGGFGIRVSLGVATAPSAEVRTCDDLVGAAEAGARAKRPAA
jgi:diguanylate cyclase (GGDEF)-like protein